jgi:hypothetical protein
LLGALHRERVSGLLELRELTIAPRVHRIHLRGGLIAAVDTPLPVPPVGELLRRRGMPFAQRHLIARIEAGDRRVAGEILATSGLASAEAVRAALAEQLRLRIDALFGITDATIAFRAARPLAHVVKVAPLEPGEFLHGRPRARDRLRNHAAPRRAPPPPSASWSVPARVDNPKDRALGLLGLSHDAGANDVRRAFRKLASMLHPDRLVTAPADEQRRGAARFAELSQAYHLLVA